MSEAFNYDVFLSHSAKDKAVVCASSLSASNGERAGVRCRSFHLAERLRKDGLKVWFDEWVLEPVVPLAHRMGEGSGVRAANASGADWAHLDASTCGSGDLPFRDPSDNERRFIPLRF